MSFRVMGRVVVVVNSAQIARDLLKKRSAIYSSKQESVMINLYVQSVWYTAQVFNLP